MFPGKGESELSMLVDLDKRLVLVILMVICENWS